MKQLNIEKVEELARNRGFKMTPQRRAVIGVLQDAKHHPTIEEIIDAVNERFPMASRATVYNTINWLKEGEMLREIVEAGSVRLDPNVDHHHHFVCRKCSKIDDVKSELTNDFATDALPEHQKVESFEITFRGVCEKCQK